MERNERWGTYTSDWDERKEVEQFQLSERRDMNVFQLSINFISQGKQRTQLTDANGMQEKRKRRKKNLRLSFARRQQVHFFPDWQCII